MLGNQAVTNKKPQGKASTKSQGEIDRKSHSNSSMFNSSKSRYDKGWELYKSNRVSISPNGLCKVCGFDVDTEKTECTCPDYQKRHEPCKHYFAACFFVKNRGKAKIEHLDGHVISTSNVAKSESEAKSSNISMKEAHSKDFNSQSTITRLAVLHTATEILKNHRKPIELSDVASLASQLEQWALGS
jgi:SWIM zinc finger